MLQPTAYRWCRFAAIIRLSDPGAPYFMDRIPTADQSPGSLAPDTLIFRVCAARLSLLGGSGRGLSWSGIVDLPLAGEPLAARVQGSSRPAHVGGSGGPVRVVGPD